MKALFGDELKPLKGQRWTIGGVLLYNTNVDTSDRCDALVNIVFGGRRTVLPEV